MPGKLLKMLSGPHLGAEVEVGENPLTIGCGAACDIIIDDHLAADRHLSLVLHDGAAVAQFNEKGFLQHNGAASRPVAAGESIKLVDGDLLAIGSTYLCVGPADGQWPQVGLPDWISLNGAAPKDSRSNQAEPEPEPGSAATAAPDDRTENKQRESAKIRSRSGSKLRWALAPVVVIAAVSLSIFGVLNSQAGRQANAKPTEAVQVAAPNAESSLEELCNAYGLKLETVDGAPSVTGEVAAPEDVQNLRTQALARAPNVDFRVYARSEILTAAAAVLSGYGYPITVKGVNAGVLSLEGWAPSQEEWERVLIDLTHDVPGVTKFDASVMFLSGIQESIGDDLGKNGLTDVRVVLANDTLECTGLMPADKQPAWKECLSKWQERFSVIRTVKDEVVLTAAPQDPDAKPAGEMKIASILFGPLRCFITADGESYYEGARLPDGNIVESIGENGVTLRRGDERKELALFAESPPATAGDVDGT